MADNIHVPVVEAAPQDAHDQTEPLAAVHVSTWRKKGQRDKVGQGVTVGVLDTGFDPHPWYHGEVHGEHCDRLAGPLSAHYKAGHGTFIAGLVLQEAPAAQVQVRKVLDAQGKGSTDDVVRAALELAQRRGRHRVHILNLSLGCYGSAAERSQFEQLLRDLRSVNPDLVVVAAAGNKRAGEQGVFLPARLADHSQLVSVGAATDRSGRTYANWSNHGRWVTFKVDGTDLVSTYLKFKAQSGNPEGRWAQWGGTSFATGLASGIIAAAMSPGGGAIVHTGPQAAAQLHRGATEVPLSGGTFPPPPVPQPIPD